MEFEFATSKRLFQSGDELSPKDAAENLLRGEERLAAFVLFAMNPAGTVCGQAAAGHDRMHVRMMHQILTPGVKYQQTANLCSQMLRIGGNLQQSLGRCTKQDAVPPIQKALLRTPEPTVL